MSLCDEQKDVYAYKVCTSIEKKDKRSVVFCFELSKKGEVKSMYLQQLKDVEKWCQEMLKSRDDIIWTCSIPASQWIIFIDWSYPTSQDNMKRKLFIQAEIDMPNTKTGKMYQDLIQPVTVFKNKPSSSSNSQKLYIEINKQLEDSIINTARNVCEQFHMQWIYLKAQCDNFIKNLTALYQCPTTLYFNTDCNKKILLTLVNSNCFEIDYPAFLTLYQSSLTKRTNSKFKSLSKHMILHVYSYLSCMGRNYV